MRDYSAYGTLASYCWLSSPSSLSARPEPKNLIPSHHNKHMPMIEDYKLAAGNCWPDTLTDYETLNTSTDNDNET